LKLRAYAFVFLGILLTSVAIAQDSPANQPQSESQRQTSTWPSSPYAAPDLNNALSDQDNVCYTMRTYLFARKDGEPLEHVATFTCTPTRQRDLKRAKTEPKLVPAK